MKKAKQVLSIFLTVLTLGMTVAVCVLQVGAVSIPADAVKYGSHYYKAYDDPMSWTDAKVYCESLGGHLATVTSSEENDFIFSIIRNKTKNIYWLGGTDKETEGIWTWITGETWNFANWSLGNPDYGAPPKPDCDRDEDDYLQIYRSDMTGNPPGTWNDDSDDAENPIEFYALNHIGFVCEWDNIYNLGEETYSFKNYGDADSKGGHCFGMSITSSAYYTKLLNMNALGEKNALYAYSDSASVRAPICYYQAIQGSTTLSATIAGGSSYYGRSSDILSDWNAVIDAVKDHQNDDRGTLQIGFRGATYAGNGSVVRGGHAINFLRYEVVDGQERVYAYDNNFPSTETYFYLDENGAVRQAPLATFSVSIDCIAIRSVAAYIEGAGRFNKMRAIYADKDLIAIDGIKPYLMDGDIEFGEHVMFELPDDLSQVRITPLVDGASFTYMDEVYTFEKIDKDTYGMLTLAKADTDKGVLIINNAPEKPNEEPVDLDSNQQQQESDNACKYCGKEHTGFFGSIIGFFHSILALLGLHK